MHHIRCGRTAPPLKHGQSPKLSAQRITKRAITSRSILSIRSSRGSRLFRRWEAAKPWREAQLVKCACFMRIVQLVRQGRCAPVAHAAIGWAVRGSRRGYGRSRSDFRSPGVGSARSSSAIGRRAFGERNLTAPWRQYERREVQVGPVPCHIWALVSSRKRILRELQERMH